MRRRIHPTSAARLRQDTERRHRKGTEHPLLRVTEHHNSNNNNMDTDDNLLMVQILSCGVISQG